MGLREAGRRCRRRRRVLAGAAARPQGGPPAAQGHQPRRRRDRSRVRACTQPGCPRRPRPGRATATGSSPRWWAGRRARTSCSTRASLVTLPGRRTGRRTRRPGPDRGRAGRGSAPGSATCPGSDIRFRTVPVADPSHRAPGAGSVALWDEQAAAEVFTAMREDKRPAEAARGPDRCRPADRAAGPDPAAGLQRRRHAGPRLAAPPPTSPRSASSTAGRGAELEPDRAGAHDGALRHPLHREHQDRGGGVAGRATGGGRRAGPHHAGRRRHVVRRREGRCRVSAPSPSDTGVRTAGDHVCS